MKVLITGGAGFIGSHLAERCLKEGWQVNVIDDLSTGCFGNIAGLKAYPTFDYVIDSVFKAPLVSEVMDDCDLVFHLAAAVGVRLIIENPVRTIETNVRGTEIVLRAAAKKRKPVIIASTSEVYGKSTKVPFCEEDDLVMGSTSRSRWSYACAKALDEFLGLAYHHEQHVPVTVVRFFNTVGPRQTARYGMVVPSFVNQALLNQPMTVYGDGHQRRCFGYVLDAVEALMRLADCPHAVGEVINIGNDQEISIQGLAQFVRHRLHSQSEIITIPYEQAYGHGFEDMARRIPSVAKLERLTGYRPTTPLGDIIDAIAAEARRKVAREIPVPAFGTSVEPEFSHQATA